MTKPYPQVRQFETISLEAEQLAQLHRERGALRPSRWARMRRSWGRAEANTPNAAPPQPCSPLEPAAGYTR
jgi:hypothetical protein